jgi:hypothetical protein
VHVELLLQQLTGWHLCVPFCASVLVVLYYNLLLLHLAQRSSTATHPGALTCALTPAKFGDIVWFAEHTARFGLQITALLGHAALITASCCGTVNVLETCNGFIAVAVA